MTRRHRSETQYPNVKRAIEDGRIDGSHRPKPEARTLRMPTVQHCDCCASWTAEPVTVEQARDEWGWHPFIDEDGNAVILCPECQ